MSISFFVETYLTSNNYIPYEFDKYWVKNWLVPSEKKNGISKLKSRYSNLWKNKFVPSYSFTKIIFFLFLHYLCLSFIIFLMLDFVFKISIYWTLIWSLDFCFSELTVILSFFSGNSNVYRPWIFIFIFRDIFAICIEYIIFWQPHPFWYWRMYNNNWWLERNSNVLAWAQVVNLPRWTIWFLLLSIVLEFYTMTMNFIVINIYSNITNLTINSLTKFSFIPHFNSLNNISNFEFTKFDIDINDIYSSFYFWCPELILFFLILLNLFIPYIKVKWYKEEKYLFLLKFLLVVSTFFSLIYFLEFKNYFFANDFFYLNSISFFFQFFILFILTIYIYNLNLSYYFKQNVNGKYYKKEKFYFYEFYSLIFSSALISILAVKSNNLFFLWFNMEILSILAYFLASFGNSDRRLVSSFVYFVFNSLAGGIILFGTVIILKNFSSDHSLITQNFQFFFFLNNFEYKLGVFLILLGFILKLGLFPFHFWNIKSYGEVSPRIFFFFVLIYKITLFFLFYRLSTSFFLNVFSDINNLLIVCCVISSIIGGLGACYEISIQKFLTYTSLVQSSYIIGGYLSNSIESITSALLYALCYFIVFLGLYLSFTLFSNKNLFFSDLPYLYYSNPFVGILFIFYIFLLIGIPPSILFFSKFLLFLNIFFSGNYLMFFVFLFVSIFTAIYYLNVIVSMLQFIGKKSTSLISSENCNNNNSVYYTSYSIDTKEFFLKPITHDFSKNVEGFQPSQFYRVIQFLKYMLFSYNHFCYFFWLLLYLLFIIISTFYLLYFYKLLLLNTEILSNLTYSSSTYLLFSLNNFDIVTKLKKVLNLKIN